MACSSAACADTAGFGFDSDSGPTGISRSSFLLPGNIFSSARSPDSNEGVKAANSEIAAFGARVSRKASRFNVSTSGSHVELLNNPVFALRACPRQRHQAS